MVYGGLHLKIVAAYTLVSIAVGIVYLFFIPIGSGHSIDVALETRMFALIPLLYCFHLIAIFRIQHLKLICLAVYLFGFLDLWRFQWLFAFIF